MLQVRLLRTKWFVLAGGLTASCLIDPQPEPPGNNAEPGAGAGGSAGVGGAGLQESTGGAYGNVVGVGGGAETASHKVTDAGVGDSGVTDVDSGSEPSANDAED